MATAPTTPTAAPTAPDRADRATFSARATAWADYQKTNLVPEMSALATNAYSNAVEAAANAAAADVSATLSAGMAAAAGATAWVSGTTYAIGNVRYSLVDFQSYRRKTAGAGTTDPSADSTNWAKLDFGVVTQDEAYAIKANIAMNAFRTATLGSYSFLKMVDGIADDYVDQTGINTVATYGYFYESATKSYICGSSYIAPGGSGNRPSITVSTNLAITSGLLGELVNGDFTLGNRVYFTYDSDISNNYVQFDFGASVTKSITEARVYAYESTTRGFWKWQGSNNGSSWVDISASVQILFGTTTWTITNQSAYRYFRIQGVSGGIDAAGGTGNGWGEVEFKIVSAGSAALVSGSVAALNTPKNVQVIIWEEDISTPILNTDLAAWVSREAGKTFTTNFAGSTSSISSGAHGFINDDQIMLSSTSVLPAGLSSAVPYFVVSSTSGAYSVSLTSGGSAVVFSSDGSGTHTARKMNKVTLTEEAVLTSGGRILSGSVDISSQASGSTVCYAIVAPSATPARIHATSVQWK